MRYAATRTIIAGFNRLIPGRKARRFVRKALIAGHEHAAADIIQLERDAEIAGGLLEERQRLVRLQKEMGTAEILARRMVTRGWRKRWFEISKSTALSGDDDSGRGRGGYGGGRDTAAELRQEIKAVRQEWKAAEVDTRKARGGDASGSGHVGRNQGMPREMD